MSADCRSKGFLPILSNWHQIYSVFLYGLFDVLIDILRGRMYNICGNCNGEGRFAPDPGFLER